MSAANRMLSSGSSCVADLKARLPVGTRNLRPWRHVWFATSRWTSNGSNTPFWLSNASSSKGVGNKSVSPSIDRCFSAHRYAVLGSLVPAWLGRVIAEETLARQPMFLAHVPDDLYGVLGPHIFFSRWFSSSSWLSRFVSPES